jgi:hypothetical protein
MSKGWLSGPKTFICLGESPLPGCGCILTEEELYYYEYVCESCMQDWGDAIERWRCGGDDDEFDKMFGEAKGD